jgi:DNA-binding transcriptional regulator YhcF (GntR family)
MLAQGKSYESIAKELEAEGITLTARTVYRYITHKETPAKSTKKLIAKVLKCAVEEIF